MKIAAYLLHSTIHILHFWHVHLLQDENKHDIIEKDFKMKGSNMKWKSILNTVRQ